VNYSENVKQDNVKIERMQGGWKMTVKYEVRRPLIYNLDIVGNFESVKELSRGATD
jgi:hypothetical protein